jgi:hypothetical protein
MDREIRQLIHDAAESAWRRFWETNPSPDDFDSWEAGPTDEERCRAIDTYLQTVRNGCSEAGVDERDYWLAVPSEAVAFRPACLADQVDQMEADLAAVSKHAGPDEPVC